MEKSIASKRYSLLLRRIRKAREESGLTQQQLAEKLGVTQSFISKCERGERRLDVLELMEFCNALEIPFLPFVDALQKDLQVAASSKRNRSDRQ